MRFPHVFSLFMYIFLLPFVRCRNKGLKEVLKVSRGIGVVLDSRIPFSRQQFYLQFRCEHKTICFCSILYRFVFLRLLIEVFFF